MKTLIFSALLAASIASYGYGQVNIMTFSSLNFGQKGSFKGGSGLGVSYDFNKNHGIGFEVKNELWELSTPGNDVASLKNFSIQYYFCQTPTKEEKWFFSPLAGVLAGIGKPIGHNSSDLRLLRHPYFAGVFLELGVGTKLSEKIRLTAYCKLEAVAGMLTGRPVFYENAAMNSNFSFGLKASFHR